MARIGDVAALQKPADDCGPKRIDCYQIVEHLASGTTFRLDPARLMYSLTPAGVVAQLDAFEAAMDSETSHRH